MTIRQMEYFVELCGTMNFTRAAENLHISQTAVTRQISLLEKEVGALLFDRSGKTVRLTTAGSFFLQEAQDTLRRFRQADANMSAFLLGNQGTLRVGFLETLNLRRLVKSVSFFKREYPHVRLNFSTGGNRELYQRLDKGELDCVVALTPPAEEEYASVLIREYPLAVCVNKSDPLAGRTALREQELPAVLFDMRRQDGPGLQAALFYIACYRGCAVVYDFLEREPYRDYIAWVPLASAQTVSVSLVYSQKNRHPVIEKFVDTMQREFYG